MHALYNYVMPASCACDDSASLSKDIAVIQNMVQLYSYLCCEVSCALNRSCLSLACVFNDAAIA